MVKKILLTAVVFVFTIACKNNGNPEIKTVDTESADLTANTIDPNITYTKAEFGIEGMTCEIGCARTIEKKIAKMDGVKFAKVDFNKKMAMVEYDPAKLTPTNLEETVTKVGDVYKVKDMKMVEEFSEE
ncbi:MAG TPA: heavy metal-associated domain-containing protein [Flavobacteriaceae bacterium]